MKMTMGFLFVTLLSPLVFADATQGISPIFKDNVIYTDSMCHKCLEVSRKARGTLVDPKLYENAGVLSSEVCNILPTHLEAKCLDRSREYVDRALFSIEELFHERNFCNKTGLCLGDSMFPNTNGLLVENKILSEFEDERDCLTCRRAIRDLKMRLKQSKIKTKITETLIEYCEEADENESQCKKTVYRYVPLVLSKFDKVKANSLCLMMGMCGGEEISI